MIPFSPQIEVLFTFLHRLLFPCIIKLFCQGRQACAPVLTELEVFQLEALHSSSCQARSKSLTDQPASFFFCGLSPLLQILGHFSSL